MFTTFHTSKFFSFFYVEPGERITAASVPIGGLLITENDFHSQNFRYGVFFSLLVVRESERRMETCGGRA